MLINNPHFEKNQKKGEFAGAFAIKSYVQIPSRPFNPNHLQIFFFLRLRLTRLQNILSQLHIYSSPVEGANDN
jgi:hypothetical protein